MMNKEELHKRLTDTYSRESWKQVVNAIFPNREFYATEEIVEVTKQAQRDLTEKIIRFGNIDLDDGNSLALYEVELKSNSSNISRNRVGLRNLITSEIIPGFVDGALIVYHQNGHDDWRFSFYSKAKYWDEEGNEIKKETHPKRYTYVLGKGETCVTPRERFWYLVEKRTRTIKDVLEAFSVEKVSNEFFTKYKKHYQAFVDELMQPENLLARQVFGTEDKLVRDFVKKMLGRLVFLQFLQKKGWLDVDPEKDFGQGNKEFIPYLFDKFKSENFYTDCLVPLFFDTLNNSYTETYTVTGTKFPYLNGGLFERDEIEKNSKADLFSFRPELFENLFNFFGEYNFTIDESTPDDLDVGIDPEMLGHIFENLLEENHSKGAYYTPKLIVQYMCQEVLIQYLELHLGKNESIAKFIRYSDRGDENDRDNFIRKNASKINNFLDKVKICDPAIGSGAFPMGLLQEILRAKLALDWTLIENKGDVKRTIIQNSIYGVDKDRGAVDIARLRFWLSLIVDEEVQPGEKPQPLPNFDYKIMQGDSLFESFKDIPLKYQSEQKKTELQRDLFGKIEDPQLNIFYGIQDELVQLEKDFFDPVNNFRKEEIRNKIDKLVATTIEKSIHKELSEKEGQLTDFKKTLSAHPNKKQIRSLEKYTNDVKQLRQSKEEIKIYLKKDEKPYFLWHLYFKEVFDQGGFDIVIGNPPFIRQELITQYKPYLDKVGGKTNYEVYNSTSDLYTYFFELGHKIMKTNKGVFSFICSKRYTMANYGKKLREYLFENTSISTYIDFIDFQVFDAGVDTSIIILNTPKKSSAYQFNYCRIKNDLSKNNPLIDYLDKWNTSLSSKSISKDLWSFSNLKEDGLKELIESNGLHLEKWDVEFNRGIINRNMSGAERPAIITG